MLQLKQLMVMRSEYGSNKGQLSGTVSFQGPHGKVELPLDEQMSQDVINICADAIVRSAQEVATELTADVIAGTPQLEDNSEETDNG